MVTHSWIQKCMKVCWVAVNMRSFVKASMKQRNTELTAGNQRLGNVKINHRIFLAYTLSSLLICNDTININVKADKGTLRRKNELLSVYG